MQPLLFVSLFFYHFSASCGYLSFFPFVSCSRLFWAAIQEPKGEYFQLVCSSVQKSFPFLFLFLLTLINSLPLLKSLSFPSLLFPFSLLLFLFSFSSLSFFSDCPTFVFLSSLHEFSLPFFLFILFVFFNLFSSSSPFLSSRFVSLILSTPSFSLYFLPFRVFLLFLSLFFCFLSLRLSNFSLPSSFLPSVSL